MNPRRILFFCLVFVAVFSLTASLYAQANAANGAIEGIVKDESGHAIPGATVIVTQMDTGIKRELLTNDDGIFRAPLLPTGKYSVEVKLEGFTPFKQEGIVVTVGRTVSMNVVLKVKGTAEQIVVTADADVIETSKTQMSTTINENYISEMPLNGRNFKDLILLTPAVVTDGPYGKVSFHGIQGVFNNLTVDGADDNNAFFGEPRSRQSRAPFQFSQDAVKEFQVINNNYSAEFGRAGGGVINVVTKSGTNEVHGSLFYYLRHDSLNARNFREAEKPEDVRHQFGGSIGGPIIKDRLFYFVNVDQQIRTQPITVLDPGIFRTFSDHEIASEASKMHLTEDYVRQKLAEAESYIAGRLSVNPLTGAYQGDFDRDLNQTVVMTKIDGNLTENNTFYVTLNYQHFDGENSAYTQPVQFNDITYNGDELRKTMTLVGQLTSIVTPNFINEFRAQYGWDDEPSTANAEFPRVDIGYYPNYFRMGRATFLPRDTEENKYQFVDNVIWTVGVHEIKTGVDIVCTDDSNYFPGYFGGRFRFNNLLNFAVGDYSYYYQTIGDPNNDQTVWDYAWYIQDKIKLTDNLTVSIGLRYDYQQFDQPDVFNPDYPATGHLPQDKNNWGPRFGFAWATSDQKLVIRGGYGIFYARTPQLLTNTAMVTNGIVQKSGRMRRTDSGAPDLGGDFNNIFTFRAADFNFPGTALYSTPDLFILPDGRENPMIQQANLEIEREIFPDFTVSIGWNFSKGDYLPRNRNINIYKTGYTKTFDVIDDTTGQVVDTLTYEQFKYNGYVDRDFRNIISNESAAKSIYHALVIKFRKRFSHGFSLLGNYTWSKAIDTAPTGASMGAPYVMVDHLNPNLRGLSDLDQRHVFNFSGVFRLNHDYGSDFLNAVLNHWKFAPRIRIGSGRPFSAVAYGSYNSYGSYSGNLNSDPYTNDRVYSRNILQGPDWSTFDFRLSRIFHLSDTTKLEFILEGFNLFNHANFYTPSTIQAYEVKNKHELHFNPDDPLFKGNFKNLTYVTAADPRQFQVAFKFIF